jgi:hypothetical protein
MGLSSRKNTVDCLALRERDIQDELYHYTASFTNIRSLTCDMDADMIDDLWTALPTLKQCFDQEGVENSIPNPGYFRRNLRHGI